MDFRAFMKLCDLAGAQMGWGKNWDREDLIEEDTNDMSNIIHESGRGRKQIFRVIVTKVAAKSMGITKVISLIHLSTHTRTHPCWLPSWCCGQRRNTEFKERLFVFCFWSSWTQEVPGILWERLLSKWNWAVFQAVWIMVLWNLQSFKKYFFAH